MHAFRLAARSALADITREGRYRVFTPLQKHADRFPVFTLEQGGRSRDVTVWSSNDYLGMGVHPVTVAAAMEAARSMGAGAGGTRNIAGTSHLHDALETELAGLHGKDAALLFTSGYVSNQAAISTILRSLPNWHVFSDAKNHASMIAGIKGAPATVHIFAHNDVADLAAKLARRTRRRAEADRLRERLFDGWRHRADRRHLRSGRPARRDDLSGRGACRRAVRSGRRRCRRARRCRAPARHDRGHAGQGFWLPWRLYHRRCRDGGLASAPPHPALFSPPRCRRPRWRGAGQRAPCAPGRCPPRQAVRAGRDA